MGTTGAQIVYFRGRYFVQFHSSEGFPAALGHAVICDIPSEPEQYQSWLQHQRDIYEQMTNELEIECLSVTEDRLRDLIALFDEEDEIEEAHELRWKDVDRDLTGLPTAFCKINYDPWGWAYLVDLDNEILSVNNRTCFRLWNIPHDRWGELFEDDRDEEPELAPEVLQSYEMRNYFDGFDEERDYYHNIGSHYQFLMEAGHVHYKLSTTLTVQQVIALVLFNKFAEACPAQIRDPRSACVYDGFAFTETVFAVLSFAACQFYLDSPEYFHGESWPPESDGFLIGPNGAEEDRLMPLFGSTCHMSGEVPGSAPENGIYWLQNVLVSVAPDSAFRDDTEPVIAKAVENVKRMVIQIFALYSFRSQERFFSESTSSTK